MPTNRTQWLWPASLLAASWLATGPAGALVVLGALALAVGSRRLFPSLGGPVLCAVAVLLEFAVLSVSALALPVVADGVLTQRSALVVLAVPLLAAAALGLVSLRATRRRTSDHATTGITSGHSAINLAPLAAFLAAWVVGTRGGGYATAWAMSGDSRNHVELIWQVIAHRGVTPDDLSGYPLMTDAVAAFLAAATGRAGLAPGQLLIHDATALSSAYLLSAAALAALFAAALLETVNATSAPETSRRWATVIVSATLGGLLVTTALVTGTGLYGGALSAYGAAALGMAVVVLALRAMTRPSAITLLLVAAGGPLLLTTWPVIALLVPPLVVLLAVRGSLARPRPTLWWPALVGAGVLAAAPYVVFFAKRAQFRSWLVAPGTVVGPSPWFFLVLILVAVGLAATGRHWSRTAMAVPLTVLLVGAVVIWRLATLGPGPMTLTYYTTKTLWLVESFAVWDLFVPVVAATIASEATARARWRASSAAVVGSAALLAAIGLVTPLTNPARSAWNGWNQPRAAGIAALERVADAGAPFVFWHWTDGGSQVADGKRIDRNLNDRILNFWSAALLDHQSPVASHDPALLPGGMITWAVNAYGKMDQLCVLAKAVPGLVVVTQDRSLPRDFRAECAGPSPTFQVGPRS
jgi:hypothetical protein